MGVLADPMFKELLLGVGEQAVGGIGHMQHGAATTLLRVVEHHEVAAVPMHDARPRLLGQQLLQAHLHAQGAEAQMLGGIGDALHIAAAARGLAQPAQFIQRHAAAMVAGHHAQTGGAAVHVVGLLKEREAHSPQSSALMAAMRSWSMLKPSALLVTPQSRRL